MNIPQNKKFSFSVVIPCKNEKNYIENCIKSILNQTYDANLIEIIIVDGYSNDGTREIIKKVSYDYPNIKLFDNPKQKTPQALNIGIKNATNEIIIILGAHTEIKEDFIELNNKFQNEKNVLVTGGTQINVGKTFAQKLIGLVMEIPFGMASAKYRWSNKEQFVDTVVYAAYRKELFNELGFFEENFTISEDAEFNWRIRQAGYKIFYSPSIQSKYYPRKSIFNFLKQIFRYGILRVNVIKKHFDSIKIYHLIPPIFTLVIIGLIITSFFKTTALYVLLSLFAIYFLINVILVFPKIKYKNILFFLFSPILIFLMHISWGSGFILGLLLPKSENL